jgi:hypothetical protein
LAGTGDTTIINVEVVEGKLTNTHMPNNSTKCGCSQKYSNPGGACGSLSCINKADPMPKDYQEEFWETTHPEGSTTLHELIGSLLSDEWHDIINDALETYGNTRALEAVEKVEKGVPEPERAEFGREDSWQIEHKNGFNSCRQATLDHIERVKKELT